MRKLLGALGIMFLMGTGLMAQNDFLPNAMYEIRYWQNMSQLGNNDVLLDTMIYHGAERAGFKYTNSECVSFHCRDTDSLIYSLLPRIYAGDKEITLGNNFIRTSGKVNVPFRARSREVYKIYVSDVANKNSGHGDYSLLSKEFGVICRWNLDGEFFQLINVDVTKNSQVLEEINLLPLMEKVYQTRIFQM